MNRLTLALALTTLAAFTSGQNLHTFKNGEPADAEKVNDNFEALRDRAAFLELELNQKTELLSNILGAQCADGYYVSGFGVTGNLVCRLLPVGADVGSEPQVGGCPDGTALIEPGLCLLPAVIAADLTLNNGVDYLMEGRVTVGNGNGELGEDGNLLDGTPVSNVTLTIQPGVQIFGKTGTFANMIITRGAKIMAMGTKSAPIVFSSDDEGVAGAGEWGGLIIHGYAPHNECAIGGTVCNIDSEGESGFAGGYDPLDNSGVLRYVVVAECGYETPLGNNSNGISLIGVGAGTEMDYIQVEGNSDDGIEFYGGTVSVKHGVFTNNLEDSVDWDEGYQGNLQYAV